MAEVMLLHPFFDEVSSLVFKKDEPTPCSPRSLPAFSYGRQRHLACRNGDSKAFIVSDMDVSRLNKMHKFLWLAGRPTSARPLHRQKMMDRQIVVTEQADLHLVWHESRIFIKPLPDKMLDYKFWKDTICGDTELHANCCGFLLSYVWLLCYPSDLKIAIDAGLVSSQMNWEKWTKFVGGFLSNVDHETLDTVNIRYQYGELRLTRLNAIHQLTHILKPTEVMRGYMYRYNRYSVFFDRNFAWVLLVFLYLTIILTAMQVGLGTTELQQDETFQRASYGFVVFSIVLPVFFIGAGFSLFACFFLYNLLSTVAFRKRQEKERQALIQSKTNRVP